MTTSEMFTEFLSNLAIANGASITSKYEAITSALNRQFRDTDSKTANSLQVGSYGRWTGINGISDLDMLYIMPSSKWDDYKDGRQSQLLDDTKDAIKSRYPTTTVKKDRLVVQAIYSDFMVEVQPVFELEDGSFKYPDTYDGGSWKVTKPREEITAMKEFVDQKNKNLRKLSKMARAWKNRCGVGIGGLLIDTLAYNFLKSSTDYDNRSVAYYGYMCRDFFEYLSNEPNKDYYLALGSNQRVNVKSKFQRKAKKAYNNCVEAIDAGDSSSAHKKWKKVFGRSFPAAATQKSKSSAHAFRDTEEFIEDLHPIDIKYNLSLECEVSQNGFREALLGTLLAKRMRLQAKKKLKFYISNINVPEGYELKWKVLNRGPVAESRDCIRGQIVPDSGHEKKDETTNFNGEHIVECYAIQNNVVVARDKILVPIQ
ncbi:hypothetical protein [uncultured Pseudoteredinibacter sp.]|uniref:SMODS domain-containing nucleotidyltransferase n=1 Tax=uncultured Pseudoteredinibacter sp. TaxID=1641701 RepID=UPI00260193A5|nr:hypothetical protein [uncultured Pseudoteredinibacter sp.]